MQRVPLGRRVRMAFDMSTQHSTLVTAELHSLQVPACGSSQCCRRCWFSALTHIILSKGVRQHLNTSVA